MMTTAVWLTFAILLSAARHKNPVEGDFPTELGGSTFLRNDGSVWRIKIAIVSVCFWWIPGNWTQPIILHAFGFFEAVKLPFIFLSLTLRRQCRLVKRQVFRKLRKIQLKCLFYRGQRQKVTRRKRFLLQMSRLTSPHLTSQEWVCHLRTGLLFVTQKRPGLSFSCPQDFMLHACSCRTKRSSHAQVNVWLHVILDQSKKSLFWTHHSLCPSVHICKAFYLFRHCLCFGLHCFHEPTLSVDFATRCLFLGFSPCTSLLTPPMNSVCKRKTIIMKVCTKFFSKLFLEASFW